MFESGSAASRPAIAIRALPILLALMLGCASIATTVLAFAPWFRTPGPADAPVANFLGNDFNAFHAAARLALVDPQSAYDINRMSAAIAEQLGRPVAYSWAYPPLYFLYVLPLAALPLLPALVVWWLATTGGLALAAAWLTRAWWIAPAVLLFPATGINLLMGQNGALSALILLLGLSALDRRPALAGAILALIAYKPHLALLLPACLAAGRHWRALLVMAATGGALAALSLGLFGWSSWHAFLAQLPTHTQYVLSGALRWERMPTLLVGVTHLGGTLLLAEVVQALGFIAALAGCAWIWRRTSDPATRSLAIASGAFLSSPYAFDYDLVLLVVPAALLAADAARRKADRGIPALLVLAWAAPYASWVGGAATGVPIGSIVVLALFAAALLRGLHLGRQPPAAHGAETRAPARSH